MRLVYPAGRYERADNGMVGGSSLGRIFRNVVYSQKAGHEKDRDDESEEGRMDFFGQFVTHISL